VAGRKASIRHEQKRQNLRLGLILATVAIAFFVGFVLKLTVFAT